MADVAMYGADSLGEVAAMKEYTAALAGVDLANLRSRVAALVETAAAVPLDHVVKRVLKEHPSWTVERAQVAATEYRKWLILCAATPELRLGMCSADVDEIWHAHILFTRDYFRCCNSLAGRYIHHQPTSDEEKQTGDNSTSVLTRAVLAAVFGSVNPIWSRNSVQQKKHDGSAADCCSDCGHSKTKAAAADCCSDCGHSKTKAADANCCSDCGHTKMKDDNKAADCCSDCGHSKAKADAANCCSDCTKQ